MLVFVILAIAKGIDLGIRSAGYENRPKSVEAPKSVP
jgi:hypothetical protein